MAGRPLKNCRRARGIHDNVVRFSAGLEDPADLLADFDQALG